MTSSFPLRDLPSAAADDARISVQVATRPFPTPGPLVREIRDRAGVALIRVHEGDGGIRYWAKNIGCFRIEPCGTRVWYRVSPGARDADVEQMLVGPVLGLALQLQGQVLLHAGAVAVDRRAIAFTAPHGFGKSTLTASFLRDGFAMLADDVLPVLAGEGQFLARHSLPRMKLWGDSLAALGDDEHRYETVLTGAAKRRVPVDRRWGTVAPDDLPLAALYLLGPHDDADRPIEIAELEPLNAALQVMASMYMAESLRGERAARALAAATRLVSTVRVRSISYHRSFDNLPALRTAIVDDVRRGGVAE